MLFSESVTFKQRFMQSRGVREKETVILICPGCHSHWEWSDTSINSPSSTKFTLVFRKAQPFSSSCRISQSYFQSQTCHCGVATRQVVVIMTIYSSKSEELFSPQISKIWHGSFYSFTATAYIYSHGIFLCVCLCLSFIQMTFNDLPRTLDDEYLSLKMWFDDH